MNCTRNCTVCLLGSRASVKAGSLLLLFSLWTRVIGMHLTEQGYYLRGLQSLYTHLPIFVFSPYRVLSELRGSRGQKSVLTLWWNYFTGKQKTSYLMYCWVHSLLQSLVCVTGRGVGFCQVGNSINISAGHLSEIWYKLYCRNCHWHWCWYWWSDLLQGASYPVKSKYPTNYTLFFGRRGQEIQRQLTQKTLSLRRIHQGVEYLNELSRSPSVRP